MGGIDVAYSSSVGWLLGAGVVFVSGVWCLVLGVSARGLCCKVGWKHAGPKQSALLVLKLSVSFRVLLTVFIEKLELFSG